jgi:hypothetical protein
MKIIEREIKQNDQEHIETTCVEMNSEEDFLHVTCKPENQINLSSNHDGFLSNIMMGRGDRVFVEIRIMVDKKEGFKRITYDCRWCSIKYDHKEDLQAHIQDRHPEKL